MNAAVRPSRSTAARWLAVVAFLLALAVTVPSASSGKAPPRGVLLTVAVSGKGKVTSTPKGIACRSKCRHRYLARASIKLVAKPAAKWSLWKWTGPCAKRNGASCTVRMNAARSVKAVFRLTIEIKPTPHYPRTLSTDAAKVLTYLGRLSNDTKPGVIVGQYCRNMGLICDDFYFQDAIGRLHDQSGKWPGILSIEYEMERVHFSDELSGANQRLIIPYSQAGGLVSITWDPANPWGPDPQNAWRDIEHHYPGADLHALLPGGAKRGEWLASLNRIAGALAELRDAGVVALWRPMQEMNHTVYWWAKKNTSDAHEVYIALWRDMFDYFTSVKSLNNLLWTFAPTGTQAWSSFPYPGDSYVDVVAGTYYSNGLCIAGYDDFLAYGKPIAMSEYGPDPWGYPPYPCGPSGIGANGSFDDRQYIERLSRDYPRIAFFVAMCSWEGVRMSLADNLYASELMNDPRVITRDRIAWR
jgi:mannan endo-1,4-beta-mannosidase